MRPVSARAVSLATAILLAAAIPASGQQTPEDNNLIGVRALLLSGGDPANDVFGGELFWKRRLNSGWKIGVGLNALKYDFEKPTDEVDLMPVIVRGDTPDTKVHSTLLSASVERDFWRSSQGRMRWSWSAGLGLNRLQFDNFRGQTTGGDPFDIKIDADPEIVLLGGADFTWSFATRWHLLSGLIVERHFADWTVMDRVSGNTGSVGDYSVLGARVGVGFSF